MEHWRQRRFFFVGRLGRLELSVDAAAAHHSGRDRVQVCLVSAFVRRDTYSLQCLLARMVVYTISLALKAPFECFIFYF